MKKSINITFGTSALQNLKTELTAKQYSSVFILVDTNTKKHCLDHFLNQCPISVTAILSMAEGEENKNLRTCEELWNDLSINGADRNSVLINL